MICPKCSSECDKDSHFCDQCGNVFVTEERPSKKRPRKFSPGAYATFNQRAIAWVVDGFAILIMAAFCAAVTKNALIPATRAALREQVTFYDLLISFLYYPVMESSNLQGTLGKLMVGIKMIDLEGNRISFGTAFRRQWGRYVSGATFGLGYAMFFWTGKKQTLHDMISGCVVIKAPLNFS